MESEIDFLSGLQSQLSDALWSERELSKKEKILQEMSEKIGNRIMHLLPPGSVLMA